MVRDMNTAEILRAAAARVRQGWCQHALESATGEVCALGALGIVAGYSSERYLDAAHALLDVIGSRDIARWNNSVDQTQENVAAGLDYAALVWEQEHRDGGLEDSRPRAASSVGEATSVR